MRIRYKYCEPKFKKWNYRHPKLLDIIAGYKADIICLQECAPYSFKTDFIDILNNKYNLSYEHIIDPSTADQDETKIIVKPATAWNTKKFKLIHHEFRSRPSLCLLQMISNDQYLLIINCHLIGDPEKWPTRFNQIKSVIKRINYILNQYKIKQCDAKVIICGDFNSPKNEIVDKLLLNGVIAKDYRSDKYPNNENNGFKLKKDYKHEYKFADAYDIYDDESKREPTYGANGHIDGFDFIYYTRNNLKCTGISKVMPECVRQKFVKEEALLLPSKDWVSDHMPIHAVLEMVEDNEDLMDNTKEEWYFYSINSF